MNRKGGGAPGMANVKRRLNGNIFLWVILLGECLKDAEGQTGEKVASREQTAAGTEFEAGPFFRIWTDK